MSTSFSHAPQGELILVDSEVISEFMVFAALVKTFRAKEGYTAGLNSKIIDEVEERGHAIAYVGCLKRCRHYRNKLLKKGVPCVVRPLDEINPPLPKAKELKPEEYIAVGECSWEAIMAAHCGLSATCGNRGREFLPYVGGGGLKATNEEGLIMGLCYGVKPVDHGRFVIDEVLAFGPEVKITRQRVHEGSYFSAQEAIDYIRGIEVRVKNGLWEAWE